MTALASILLSPLDRLRTALLLRAIRLPALRPLLVKKQRRVPALLLAHAALAFGLALLAPTYLLMLGPLVVGVPHLVSDVRQLVLRPALPRFTRTLFLGGSALLVCARLLEGMGVPGMARTELGLAGALAVGAVALAVSRARALRAAAALLVISLLFGCALAWPQPARLLLGHGHNVIALLLWAAFYARGRRSAGWVLGVVLALGALLLFSPLAWLGFQHGVTSAFGLHSLAAVDTLAPGVQSAPLGLGIVACFAFLQSVHYAVWLHAIPQDATLGNGTLSFRMTWRALERDLGGWALGACLTLALLVPLCGVTAPLLTKAAYLSLSTFHGYLELAAAALFFVRRRGPLSAS